MTSYCIALFSVLPIEQRKELLCQLIPPPITTGRYKRGGRIQILAIQIASLFPVKSIWYLEC